MLADQSIPVNTGKLGCRTSTAVEPIECLDGPEGCEGHVTYRYVAPREIVAGRASARCERHWLAAIERRAYRWPTSNEGDEATKQ
jgi:hypothetical protein